MNMSTNGNDVFSMLNSMFSRSASDTKTNERKDESVAKPTWFQAPVMEPKREFTIGYRLNDSDFAVTIPDDMTMEDIVACIGAACKYVENELHINGEALACKMLYTLMEAVSTAVLSDVRKMMNDFLKEV